MCYQQTDFTHSQNCRCLKPYFLIIIFVRTLTTSRPCQLGIWNLELMLDLGNSIWQRAYRLLLRKGRNMKQQQSKLNLLRKIMWCDRKVQIAAPKAGMNLKSQLAHFVFYGHDSNPALQCANIIYQHDRSSNWAWIDLCACLCARTCVSRSLCLCWS